MDQDARLFMGLSPLQGQPQFPWKLEVGTCAIRACQSSPACGRPSVIFDDFIEIGLDPSNRTEANSPPALTEFELPELGGAAS